MSFGGDSVGEEGTRALGGVAVGGVAGVGLGAAGAGVGGLRRRGRATREQLATVVRKNFNAQPISESDVIVNFLYSVKNQGEFWGPSWGEEGRGKR